MPQNPIERLAAQRDLLALLLAVAVFFIGALLFALYAEDRREPAPQIHSTARPVAAINP